ncbi:MAG TPA: copper resistance protein CopC [Ktedonobacterales bacterium]
MWQRFADVHAGNNMPIRRGKRARYALLGAIIGLSLAVFSFLPVGSLSQFVPAAAAQSLSGTATHPLAAQMPAHALLVRSVPAARAILQTPPINVQMWFSESVNPLTSRAVVVDTTNREVDNRDNHVSSSDPKEMIVTLPPLPAGTYVVVWRTQSAEDGHIVGGSFFFQIARPDGTVPPVPAVLPTGNIPGAGGSGTAGSASLDGPSSVQALFTWLALVFLGFWVGGLIWETWILSPGRSADSDLAAASALAARRFRRLTMAALLLLLVSDLGIVFAQVAELAGEWSGIFSLPLLKAVLFGSQFGTFWLLRQAIALVGLAVTLLVLGRSWSVQRSLPGRSEAPLAGSASDGVRPWWPALLETLRSVLFLPRRLVAGWRGRSWLGRLELALGAALIVAFALSGHAAALPSSELTYGLSVDLLHLVAMTAWVGGLFYIAVVFLPALKRLAPRQRARVLALGLPEFSALAIVGAFLLAATGSLNTIIHLTSIDQFITTAYGRTLTIKIGIFLLMVLISAYHAFVLRPRLVQALNEPSTLASRAVLKTEEVVVGTAGSAHVERAAEASSNRENQQHDEKNPVTAHIQRLAGGLEGWLRREALLGCAVLLCVALLAAFAGSLYAPPPAATSSPTGAFVQTQHVSGYTMTLKVTPARFGTNTFTATILDAKGQPVKNAEVLIQVTMVEMDMGVENEQLKPDTSLPAGSYSGQADLTMGGHWNILLKVLPPNAPQFVTATFTVAVSY